MISQGKQFYCDKEFLPAKPGGFSGAAGRQGCCILDNTGILALFVSSFTYCYKEVELQKMLKSYDILKVRVLMSSLPMPDDLSQTDSEKLEHHYATQKKALQLCDSDLLAQRAMTMSRNLKNCCIAKSENDDDASASRDEYDQRCIRSTGHVQKLLEHVSTRT